MAGPTQIVCPSCEKKFKGKPELVGKKIKCPACAHPFVVAAEAPAKAPAAAPAPSQPAAKGPPKETAYGVTHMDFSARCPNCANLMETEKAIICLFCGYNTQTRKLGDTKHVVAHTLQERLMWLMPGIASAAFLFAVICVQLYVCTILPHHSAGKWYDFLNHESMRLWGAFIFMGMIWGAGYYVLRRLVLEPTPPEKKKLEKAK